jgi:Kef-type K+ transport system membrane component KefB
MLLSTRVAWQSAAILLGLVLLCVLIAWRGAAARRRGSRVYRLLVEKANSTAQTMVRLTMFLLVLLVTVSAVFDVDIVLGAFAAGFVLQYLVPKDDEAFDQKLNGMGYGFFIPVFFIYSGTKIDVTAVAGRPLTFAMFILALLLVRSVPVFVLAATDRGNPRWLSVRASASVAVYCATALPLVVAVTTIAVGVGAMSQGMASVLVAAGAVTVFLMPLLGQLAICAAGASELDVATLAEDTADLGPAAASAATAAVAAPAGSAAGAASAAGVAPAAPAGVATGAPEARGRHAAAHGHAHERHAARIALRMHIERMIESGESPEAVARYLAEELHFEGDEHRVHAVERRIERMQGSHRRVY